MELDPVKFHRMIAEGETQIDALRRGLPRDVADPRLGDRISAIEERLDQQEAVLRHTLTMLIEWFDGQGEG